MQNSYQDELVIENMYFEQVLKLIQDQLSAIEKSNQSSREDLIRLRKEMWENTAHSLNDFDSVAEISQYLGQLAGETSTYEAQMSKIQILLRMLDTAYFARIDFKRDDKSTFEKIYIGRAMLKDDKTHRIYVYDWRSPISSLFYRFETGSVFYEAPAGRIVGEVSTKRQYEIKKGKLEYFFDADVQIVDEFLRKMLSQNTSTMMKTIVETIQKDQDIIIRDGKNELLMVQGVAGSGKTSIALHRVAYLMYQGLSSRLAANNIIILSPNTLFAQYISGVLPELGEKNVISVIFEQLIETILGNAYKNTQSKNEMLENLIACNNDKHKLIIKSSMEFKASGQFAEILKRFVFDIPYRWIEFRDVYYDGRYVADRFSLKTRLLNRDKDKPLTVRLERLERTILETVREWREDRLLKLKGYVKRHTEHSFDAEEFARLLSIWESTVLIKNIRTFTKVDFVDLYRQLFRNKDYFYRLAKGIALPDCIEDIIDYTNEKLEAENLQYEDALALSLFWLELNGFHEYKDIRQVVVDEAQDYYPIHFEILNRLFPNARYTILGDINQTIEKLENISLYDMIQRILCKEKSTLITMSKSFRCTNEILIYSGKFLETDTEIQSVNRSGDTPNVYWAENRLDLDQMIIDEAMSCRERSYQSVGIICKTEKDATSLYERIKDKLNVRLVSGNSIVDLKGIFIIPVYMSKGLEFDAVLIDSTDLEHYRSEEDKKLLYIACTRALHRLNLFYTGSVSPLL